MKLNNKGFAISTILYGLLTMGSLILLLLLGVLGSTKRNNDTFIGEVEQQLNACVQNKTC